MDLFTTTQSNASYGMTELTTSMADEYLGNYSTQDPAFLSPTIPPNKYVSQGTHTLLGIFLLFVTIFGVIENITVIHLLWKEKRLHSLTNAYITVLAISNLLMALIGAPFASISSFYGQWVFGDGGCVFHGFAVMFLGLTDLYLITAIAIDRYIILVKPTLRPKMTPRLNKVIIFTCVMIALVWSIFPLVGWNSFTYEGLHTSCSINWMSRKTADVVYILILYVLFFCFPVVIIAYCYTNIVITVRRGFNSEISKKMGKKRFILERQITVTLFLIFVSFLVSWLPYAVVCLMIVAGYTTTITPLIATIPAYIAKASVVWNPLLYVVSNKMFRTYFIEFYMGQGTAQSCMPPKNMAQLNTRPQDTTLEGRDNPTIDHQGIAPAQSPVQN